MERATPSPGAATSSAPTGRLARRPAAGSVDSRSSFSMYIAEILRFRRLTRVEETRLARKAQSDPRAQNRLVQANLGFVITVAKEFRGRGLPFEDLVSEGNLGLIEAARRFDPGRGAKFITYAAWWIRKAMWKAVAEQSRSIHVSDYQRRQARQGSTEGHESDGRRSTWFQAGAECSAGSLRMLSLDAGLGEVDGPVLGDRLAAASPDPETEVMERALLGRLQSAMSSLSPRERAILSHRFGLGEQDAMTLRRVGALLGLSHERVRQLEQQAKRQIRRILAGPCR